MKHPMGGGSIHSREDSGWVTFWEWGLNDADRIHEKKSIHLSIDAACDLGENPHSWLMVDGKRQPSMVGGWANRFALANIAKNLL